MQKILRLAEQNQSANRKKTKVENFFSSWFFGKKKKKDIRIYDDKTIRLCTT